MVERVKDTTLKRTIARAILENLHDWFEMNESREQYIRECSDWMFFAAKENGEYAGFLCLKAPAGRKKADGREAEPRSDSLCHSHPPVPQDFSRPRLRSCARLSRQSMAS